MTDTRAPEPSSRLEAQHAGWGKCQAVKSVEIPPDAGTSRKLSWASPRPLWQCRNQVIAQVFGDPTPDHRNRWLDLLGRHPDDPLLVTGYADRDSVSFLVIGDTGEGDASQYRVVPTLLHQGRDTDFMFICSDVIYPAGGVEEYGPKVLGPYREYPGSIYAIPGNHGWFDDADGFMYWFCNADQRPARRRTARFRARELLWRRSPQGRMTELIKMAGVREPPRGSQYDDHRHLQVAVHHSASGAGASFHQPGPYFALDAGPVKLVALDFGVDQPLDRRQADWLRRTSAVPGPKILLLEMPLYVDGQLDRLPIEGGGTIHEVATDPGHEYLAVLSGNTHNYQRYLVSLDAGRQMPFIVTGGGGAFLHETHTIDNLDHAGLDGVDEASFRCYPLRGDSLARCAQLWDRKLGGRTHLALDPDVAARIAADRIAVEPARQDAREARPTMRDNAVASLMYHAPGHPHTVMHTAFSSLLDWGEPPLFKHFVRVDASADVVCITCHAVTGWAEDVDTELVEDRLVARRDGARWIWTTDSRG